MESDRRSLPGIARQVPRAVVAGGVGAALLGVTLAVTFWPDTGSRPGAQAVAAADDRDAALAAALRATAALRADERASRNRPGSPGAAPSVGQTPAPGRAPVPAVVGQRWVTSDVNVRSGPSTGHDPIDLLAALTRADITGVTESGWTQVVTDGRAGWVRSTYLSTSKPNPQSERVPGTTNASCPISTDVESHLTSNARAVYRAVCAAFGDSVSSFGGYRAGDGGDHGSGKAVDIMVSGEPGWDIARYLQAHSRELKVTYVIYQQQIWLVGDPTSQWKTMEDRGSRTANHFDHVHVSVS